MPQQWLSGGRGTRPGGAGPAPASQPATPKPAAPASKPMLAGGQANRPVATDRVRQPQPLPAAPTEGRRRQDLGQRLERPGNGWGRPGMAQRPGLGYGRPGGGQLGPVQRPGLPGGLPEPGLIRPQPRPMPDYGGVPPMPAQRTQPLPDIGPPSLGGSRLQPGGYGPGGGWQDIMNRFNAVKPMPQLPQAPQPWDLQQLQGGGGGTGGGGKAKGKKGKC